LVNISLLYISSIKSIYYTYLILLCYYYFSIYLICSLNAISLVLKLYLCCCYCSSKAGICEDGRGKEEFKDDLLLTGELLLGGI